jgi:N-glycosylase/DNA lyase
MIIRLRVPNHFNFRRTVYSHGWCALPPFEVTEGKLELQRIIELSSERAVSVKVHQSRKGTLVVEMTGDSLAARDLSTIRSQISDCLRLDEDFGEFYAEAKKHGGFRWIPRMGAGRLLRAPTVFEDVVKMICTTNCSWSLTEVMVGNLCTKLGFGGGENKHAFPRPEAMAECSERFFRNEIRAGYRAPCLREFARRVARGLLDVEAWRASDLATAELFKAVQSVKGVGPYAAGNILKLLGRYDYLGIDSWSRRKFFDLHRNGKVTKDSAIERFYEPYGKWRGLFFWLDVTKHWYDKELPF